MWKRFFSTGVIFPLLFLIVGIQQANAVPFCGDGFCDNIATCFNLASSKSTTCETQESCPADCVGPLVTSGDYITYNYNLNGICEPKLNELAGLSPGCVETINGVCDRSNGEYAWRPDCYCGDGFCDRLEYADACPSECGTCNNNGVCETDLRETHPSCPLDCPQYCTSGKFLCNSPGDGHSTCATICNGVTECPSGEDEGTFCSICPIGQLPLGPGPSTCVTPCNGVQEAGDDGPLSAFTVSVDPVPTGSDESVTLCGGCGDGFPQPGETALNCPFDLDYDGDGVPACQTNQDPALDSCDNCSNVANPDQKNTDAKPDVLITSQSGFGAAGTGGFDRFVAKGNRIYGNQILHGTQIGCEASNNSFNSSNVNSAGIAPFYRDHDCAAGADFNGDGFADLVVANYFEKSVSVFLNNNGTSFNPKVDYTLPAGPSPLSLEQDRPEGVVVADFNNDTYPDIAVANSYTVLPTTKRLTITIMLNNGLGIFSTRTTYNGLSISDPRDVRLGGIAIGDFNGDNIPDLALTSKFTGSVSDPDQMSIYLNNGLGGFPSANVKGPFKSESTLSLAEFDPTGLVVADFNQDGKDDVAMANYKGKGSSPYTPTITIFLGDGTGGVSSTKDYQTDTLDRVGMGTRAYSIAVSDFDHQNGPDLVVVGSWAGGTLTDRNGPTMTVFYNNGLGAFNKANRVGSAYVMNSASWSDSQPLGEDVVATDLNGDGYDDVVFSMFDPTNLSNPGKLGYRMNNGAGQLVGPIISFPLSSVPRAVVLGDFIKEDDLGDVCDADDDNDGQDDTLDNCPLDYNPTQTIVCTDTDGDGLTDGVETSLGTSPTNPDTDGDGCIDSVDFYPLSIDGDGDGLCDCHGGLVSLGCNSEDTNANGVCDPGETCADNQDTDGDGCMDALEQSLLVVEGDPLELPRINFVLDADPSTQTDSVASDTDGDGLVDCGPNGEDTNSNGKVDPGESDPNNAGDSDGDGNIDGADNCPGTANANQLDTDHDGIGNACDPCPNDPINDPDQDGRCAKVDNCPHDYNPDQADSDGDGIGNMCDNCANDPQNDVDGDDLCGDVDPEPHVAGCVCGNTGNHGKYVVCVVKKLNALGRQNDGATKNAAADSQCKL